MSDTITIHPLIQRFVAMRDGFHPGLTDDEIRQMQELAEANPNLEVNELNAKIGAEFGLQARYDACQSRERDIDAMTNDFKEVIVKWKLVQMADPLVVAGSVLNHLTGLSAVLGCYVEDLYKRASEKS